MIKTETINNYVFLTQTTYYIYKNKEAQLADKPMIITSDTNSFERYKEQLKNTAIENATENNETETCVICGKETNVLKTTHVDLRHNYIEGAGQLCEQCGEIYNKKIEIV